MGIHEQAHLSKKSLCFRQAAWQCLVDSAPADALEQAATAQSLQQWIQLASTQAGCPLNGELLFSKNPASSQVNSSVNEVPLDFTISLQKYPALEHSTCIIILASFQVRKGKPAAANGVKRVAKQYVGGVEDGSAASLSRNEAAKALGTLAAAWPKGAAYLLPVFWQPRHYKKNLTCQI